MFKLKNKLNSEIFKRALEGKDIVTYGEQAIKDQLIKTLTKLYLMHEKDKGYQHSSGEVEKRAKTVIFYYSPKIMEVVSGSYNYIKYGSILAPKDSGSGKGVPGKDSSMSSSESANVETQIEGLMESGVPKNNEEEKKEKPTSQTDQNSTPEETGGDFDGLNM